MCTVFWDRRSIAISEVAAIPKPPPYTCLKVWLPRDKIVDSYPQGIQASCCGQGCSPLLCFPGFHSCTGQYLFFPHSKISTGKLTLLPSFKPSVQIRLPHGLQSQRHRVPAWVSTSRVTCLLSTCCTCRNFYEPPSVATAYTQVIASTSHLFGEYLAYVRKSQVQEG